MWTQASDFLLICFSGANLPACILLVGVILYSLIGIIVGLDFDLGVDVDVDIDADADFDVDADPSFGSTLGLGFVVLRFFNIGRVPLMIWAGVFAICYWMISIAFDRFVDDRACREQLLYAVQYGVRNLAVAVVVTKIFTHPLRDRFAFKEPNRLVDLMGQQCTITTSTVTDSFGQAEYKTEATPLRLNVRAKEAPLSKGDTAVIVGFDKEKSVYFVEKADSGE
jgi:hypothetical protein